MTDYKYLPSVQSSSGTSSGTSTTTPAPTAENAYNQAISQAMGAAATPYQPYGGTMIAGFNPDQIAAQQGYRDALGVQTPYIQQASNLYSQSVDDGNSFAAAAQNPNMAQAGDWYKKSFEYIQNKNMDEARNLYAQAATAAKNGQMDVAAKYTQDAINLSNMENFNQQALNRYMNPYQQSVVDATLANMKQNQDVLMNQNTANAIRQGAYGGSGQFMGMAEIARQQALSNAQTLAQLNAQNYNQAMGQYNQQQQQAIGARQQGAQTMGQLGQAQAQTLAQAYSQAAQGMGELGNAESNRGVGAYQGAASGWGNLGQSQAQLNLEAEKLKRGMYQSAAQGIAGLGTQAQQGALTGLGALASSGAQQQQLTQADFANDYNQWQMAKADPFQKASFLSGIVGGLGPNLGSTSTSNSSYSGTEFGMKPYQNQSTNTLGQILGAATSAASFIPGLRKDGGRVERDDGGSVYDRSLGSLMTKRPYYDAPNNYIMESLKLMESIPSARDTLVQKAQSELGKALGASKVHFSDLGGDSGGGGGSDRGGDWMSSLGSLAKTVGSKYGSKISDTLGSVFSADGGRIEKWDGGSTNPRPERDTSKDPAIAQQILENYQKYLGRAGDQAGFDYWFQRAKSGTPAEYIEKFFQTSPERLKNVREAYVDILGRAPEPGGYAFWADQATKGMTFGDLQNAIKNSPESMYRNILDRAPDQAGFDYWTKQRMGGLDPLFAQFNFQNSPEAQKKASGFGNVSDSTSGASTTTPSMSDKLAAGFASLDPSIGINKMRARDIMLNPLDERKSDYDLLLGQARKRHPGPQLTPEQQGMPSMPDPNYYMTQLPTYNYYTQQEQPTWADGSSSSAAAPSSADANKQFLTGLYNRAFMRKPDEAGLAYWQDQMAKGMTPEAVRRGFDVSPEHLNTAPVQGYFTKPQSLTINPETGLVNKVYVAPYFGRPTPANLSTGGRAEKARGGVLSKEDIARAALQAGATPQEAAILTAIAMPESSGNPYAHNTKRRDNSYGLWQINMLGKMGPERVRQFGLKSYEDLFDPVTNAKAALQLLRSKRGANHWSTYMSGKYKPYYSMAANLVNDLVKDPNAVNTKIAMPERPAVMASDQHRRPGLLTRLANAFSPISTAQAGESVLNRINPNDPSGPLLPESGIKRPRGAAENYISGHERPRTTEELGLTKQPDGSFSFTRQPEWYTTKTHGAVKDYRDPYDAGNVTSADFPMSAEPMGTGFSEKIISDDRPQEASSEPSTVTSGAKTQTSDQGQKYWGDWRDQEPWKSDPIGGFFDQLSGETPQASKPGKAPTREEEALDLGKLFDFFS